MPLVPIAPPQPVPIYSFFDYVTVDAERRRLYAAHYGSETLVVANADTGRVLGQVHVGPMDGLAVDPKTGHVFTADGTWRTVSEVDPQSMKELRTVDLPGDLDALAYDAALHRIYVDEELGTKIFVVEAKTLKLVATIHLPGHWPEYLAVDPQTHDVYQNILDKNAYAVVDTTAMRVRTVISTAPEIRRNHPLQYDVAYKEILTAGSGKLGAYDRSGHILGRVSIQHVDQCDLDQASHLLACAGGGKIAVFRTQPGQAPAKLGELAVPADVHSVAIDSKTKYIWTVWTTPQGDFIQRFSLR